MSNSRWARLQHTPAPHSLVSRWRAERTYAYGGTRDRDASLDAYLDWPDPLPNLIAAADPDRLIINELNELRPPRSLVVGRVALVGDAAHAMRPTFGQGAGTAMEDALVLAHYGLDRYSSVRRRRVNTPYWASRLGSLITMPTQLLLTAARDAALQASPNRLLATLAGAGGHWRP